MKRIGHMVAALLVVGSAASFVLAHEGEHGPEGKGPKPGFGVEMMKEKLGLSAEQSEKMKAAMEAMHKATMPFHEKMKADMEKLREQVKSGAKDDEISATLARIKETRKAMQAQGEKSHDEMEAILTPVQRAKMVVGMGERMHRMGGMMHHHHGDHKEGGPGMGKPHGDEDDKDGDDD